MSVHFTVMLIGILGEALTFGFGIVNVMNANLNDFDSAFRRHGIVMIGSVFFGTMFLIGLLLTIIAYI